MAVAIDTNYIYPPNLAVPMTAAAGETPLNRIAVRFNITHATGDADITGADFLEVADFLGPNGTAPSEFVIEEAEWSISGMDAVVLLWEATADTIAISMSGAGFKDYRSIGGLHTDAAAANRTGDIVYSTVGVTDTATAVPKADISLVLRLKD